MLIRKAKSTDANQIFQNIQDCKEEMKRTNTAQWKEGYPTFADTVENIPDTLVVDENNIVVASVVINEKQAKEYDKINWSITDKNPLVIHRLAVSPKYHGKRFAQKLIQYVEDFAKTNNYKSIRLDTYSKNIASNKFYAKIGFKEVGRFYFTHLQPEHYIAFEKVLINTK